MKGLIQLTAIAALASLGAVASAQNLLNGDFENSHGHASLSNWLPIGIVDASTSTFVNPPDAAYVNGIGSVSQFVSLTAGDQYDLSGQAALFKGANDTISVGQLLHLPVLSETDVTGNFSYDFDVTKSGLYAVSFAGFGNFFGGAKSEFSGLSLTQVQSTPEPCSILALGVGIAGIFRVRRRR